MDKPKETAATDVNPSSDVKTTQVTPVVAENCKTMVANEQQQMIAAPEVSPKLSNVPQLTTATPVSNLPLEDLEAYGSQMSIGFGESTCMADSDDRAQTLVIRDGPESFRSILHTTIGYAIRCQHGRMPLQKVKEHNGYWLPYVAAPENGKYLDSASKLYDYFLAEFTELEQSGSISKTTSEQDDAVALAKKKQDVKFLDDFHLFSISRYQIPDGQFISRYIFLAQWSVDQKGLKPQISCCQDTTNIQWYSIELILQEAKKGTGPLIDRLWGYEVVTLAGTLQKQIQGVNGQLNVPQIQEFTSNEVLRYLQRPLNGGSTKAPNTTFAQMLSDSKFTEKDVIKMYCDYVQHCFPSGAMTFCSFTEYFHKIGFLQFDDASMHSIFRAMNFKAKHFMLFNEFLLGLAALDSNAPNSKLRFTYIFRYYDRDSDQYLDEGDFRQMVTDIRYKANLSCNQTDVETDVQARLATLKLLDASKRISYKTFLNEAQHIGGIMHLFRTNKAILEGIHTRHAYEIINHKSGKPFTQRLTGTCPKCKPKKYSLSYHTVRLNIHGKIDDPKVVQDLKCGEIDKNLQFKQKVDQNEMKHSAEVVFNSNSVANKVLNIVRKLQDLNKAPRDRQKEASQAVVKELTPSLILALCKEVSDILLIEPRVLKVNTPCIVIGDTHGNINDVLTYEDQLWPLAPAICSPNILFLGDYVDRGDYSIEVISYLFAMKILAPTKFFLLRGNHEIRAIQRNFTFFKECMMKYPYKDGQAVFDAFNSAFDNLPLVGIIDEQIFCAHGGIPFSVTRVEELYKIPIPLYDPEIQSKPAWEILWSDPITDEEYREVCQFHNQSAESGFADNIRRSTAYYFTEKALRNFLKNNGLSHVIRAHELEMDGYRFHHSGLLVTVFSSSRYCNALNRSSSIFVDTRGDNGYIKVVSLDT